MTIHPPHRNGDSSPRLFGAFLEPIGSIASDSMFTAGRPDGSRRLPVTGRSDPKSVLERAIIAILASLRASAMNEQFSDRMGKAAALAEIVDFLRFFLGDLLL